MSKKLEPLNLSESKIKELQTQYKQARDRRIAERIHCIILYAQGKDLNELKRILFVGLKTLKKWIKTYLVQGLDGLRQWGYQGQERDLSAAQWAEVEAELERRPYRTAQEVVGFVKKKFDLTYSERGMQNLLRHKGYRRIKTRLLPGPVDEDKQREQREFIERYFNFEFRLTAKDSAQPSLR